MVNDNIQHEINEKPGADSEKGAALGGLGGVAVGAAAGSLAGPVGTLIGAVAGGLIGAGAAGSAVGVVDAVDDDNTTSGVSGGPTHVVSSGPSHAAPVHVGTVHENIRSSSDEPVIETGVGGHNIVTGGPATTEDGNTGLATGAIVGGLIGTAVGGPLGGVVGGTLGSLAGGAAGDAAEASKDKI
ncbi:MAG TPA: hypothetical protein VF627_13885 [Abditibacterium sp.]